MKRIIAILLVLAFCVDADAQLLGRWGRGRSNATSTRRTSGRDCQSPRCLMCALNYGPMPGYAIRGNKVVWVGLQSVKPKPKLDPVKAELAATPQPVVDVMLVLAGLTPDDVLLDPGCGDGRFVVTAAARYGCRTIGIEIDPATAATAEQAVQAAGVGHLATILRGDARSIGVPSATVVTLYLFPKDIEAMWQAWPNARMVLSNSHEIPGVENQKLNLSVEGQEHVVYFWTRDP